MGFRENLRTKIRIERLADRVRRSLGPDGSPSRLDREALRELLALSPFLPQRVRDLELFVEDTPGPVKTIVVLDNELPIYRTTVADVALRKSPEVAEMVRPRNIVRILRDGDVKRSRKHDSLEAIRAACLARLDLSWRREDIEDLRRDGIASWEGRYLPGVEEALALFAELLGWKTPPGPFRSPQAEVFARLRLGAAGETVLGPAVFFLPDRPALGFVAEDFAAGDPAALERYRAFAEGRLAAPIQGEAVFARLRDELFGERPGGP